MTRKLVWFEGVDFDDCVFDTNDISTIRGASLALLDAPKRLGRLIEARLGLADVEVFSGASQGLYRVPSDRLEEAEAIIDDFVAGTSATDADLPLAALRFVRGVSDLDESEPVVSMRRAQADARRAQLQGAASRSVEEPGKRPCPIERRRPANASIQMPFDRARDLGLVEARSPTPGTEAVTVAVSASVRDRRAWGRTQRKIFYTGRSARNGEPALEAETAGWWGTWGRFFSTTGGATDPFVHDLQEMVAQPPAKAHPLSVENKIAVLYADGNGFGEILSSCRTLEAVTEFSTATRSLMRKILEQVLDRLCVIAFGIGSPSALPMPPPEAAAYTTSGGEKRLRFESLLYGGDEICWVFPAWIALDVVNTVIAALDRAMLAGQPATFSCGLVIADRKMPIADLRSLAHDAADLAKVRGIRTPDGGEIEPEPATRIAIEVFESIEPPSGGLAAYRRRTIGEAADVRRFLSLDRQDLDRVVEWIRGCRVEGTMARSQIIRILTAAQRAQPSGTGGPRRLGTAGRATDDGRSADEIVKAAVTDHANRVGRPAVDLLPGLLADPLLQRGDDGSPLGRAAAPALDLWLAAQLWDYIDPFA